MPKILKAKNEANPLTLAVLSYLKQIFPAGATIDEMVDMNTKMTKDGIAKTAGNLTKSGWLVAKKEKSTILRRGHKSINRYYLANENGDPPPPTGNRKRKSIIGWSKEDEKMKTHFISDDLIPLAIVELLIEMEKNGDEVFEDEIPDLLVEGESPNLLMDPRTKIPVFKRKVSDVLERMIRNKEIEGGGENPLSISASTLTYVESNTDNSSND